MCLTNKKAKLENTFIWLIDLPGNRNKLIYQNESSAVLKGTAMILPFPTKGRVVVTEEEESLVSNKYEQLLPPFRGDVVEKGLTFQKVGSYDCVQVPDLDEIEMTKELREWFHKEYAGWQFMVCYFNPENNGKKHPLGFEYEELNSLLLRGLSFIPMVDGHDGKKPSNGYIRPQQKIIVTSQNRTERIIDLSLIKTNNTDLWISMFDVNNQTERNLLLENIICFTSKKNLL